MKHQTDILPRNIRGNRDAWKALAAAGVLRSGDIDYLFCHVVLPEGWHKKKSKECLLHEDLLCDDKGRHRARIYHEFDGDAFMIVLPRFGIGSNTPRGVDSVLELYDGGLPVLKTRIVVAPSFDAPHGEWERYHSEVDTLRCETEAWLSGRAPDWKNPAAYWEDPIQINS